MRTCRAFDRRTWPAVAGAGLVATLFLGPSTALEAQTLEGVVRDAESREALEAVELVLRNDRETLVARAATDANGRFVLPVREPGPHTLDASLFGYAPVPTMQIEVGREVVEVEILLSRTPLELEPLVVRGRRHDPRHDPTFDGAMARYARLPTVGSRRVVLRTDPEFTGALVVRDVLRWFPPARGCTIVFADGRVANTMTTAEMWLTEASASFLEAVEYYRTWNDAPFGLRDVPSYVLDPTRCAVVALWRRLDPPPQVAGWRRALGFTVAVGAAYVAGWLWSRR